MNILILSPGRRVEVVEYFKEVFHRDGGLVYTLDMSPYAPALYFGDKYFCVEKDFNHIERYVQNIIFICENYGIKSVISLIDPELVLLSQYQGEFDKFGIKTILSDIRFTESTFDKYVFYQKLLLSGKTQKSIKSSSKPRKIGLRVLFFSKVSPLIEKTWFWWCFCISFARKSFQVFSDFP